MTCAVAAPGGAGPTLERDLPGGATEAVTRLSTDDPSLDVLRCAYDQPRSVTAREMKSMSANSTTIEVVQSFEEAINRHDLDAAMALMTEDCVFETTLPAPDGTRYVGQAAVRAACAEFSRRRPKRCSRLRSSLRAATGQRSAGCTSGSRPTELMAMSAA